MPHLDACALTQDPDGLAFLADVLGTGTSDGVGSWVLRPSVDVQFPMTSRAPNADRDDVAADGRDFSFA